jgi:hypothetical protein
VTPTPSLQAQEEGIISRRQPLLRLTSTFVVLEAVALPAAACSSLTLVVVDLIFALSFAQACVRQGMG